MINRRKTVVMCLIAVIILIALIAGFENRAIFKMTSSDVQTCYNKICESSDVNVMLVSYHITTGAGWVVEQSSDERLTGKSAILQTKFDPRFLKVNDDFCLDYMAQYVITAKKIVHGTYEGEDILKIYPDDITICYADSKDKVLRVHDMSLNGKIKFLIGCIARKYWRSI